MIKKTLIQILYALREDKRNRNILGNNIYKNDKLAASIIRLAHSIEKGLSIESPCPGFGYTKIESLASMIDEYMQNSSYNLICVCMASDAIKAYCDYHDSIGFTSQQYDRIKEIYCKIKDYCHPVNNTVVAYGGVQTVLLNELDYDINEIEKLFETRHSIREFDKTHVSIEKIKKAVALAQCAPSACNRQAVRVYAIDSKKYVQDLNINLEGIGGFTDDIDQFLLITGKLSAYDEFEYNQFVVSAGIFAGYLSLALHAYHIGACIIQRSLRTSKQWIQFCKKNNIPEDEQIVCMIGIGCMKDSTIVPISYRDRKSVV